MSRIYLYGFVPGDAPLPEGGLLGVGDGVVELIEEDDLAAVVSEVPDGEFGNEQLELRSADLEWMAEQGLRHEQVVAWFVDHASILPSRLLTLFSGRDAVRAAAGRDRGRIREALERFAGVREWDLKVGYDPDRLAERLAEVSEPIAALDREIESATPGKRFLLRKKRADLTRVETRAAARRLADELLDRLAPVARETRSMGLPAEDAPVLLNTAFLVDREREAALVGAVDEAGDRLAELGVTARLTGPWAPYRFLETADE